MEINDWVLEGRFLPFTVETVVLAGEDDVLWGAASLTGTGFPVTLWSKDDRPCSAGADCVWVLERADRMLSGVISTLERIFARGL